MGEREDLPLEDDIAEVHREVQVAVNDVKAAEVLLAEKNARLDAVLKAVEGVSPVAAAFIADFRNPATDAPAPLVADVPERVFVPETSAEGEGAAEADGAAEATGE